MATKTKAAKKPAKAAKPKAQKKASKKKEAPKKPVEHVTDPKHPGRFINDARGPAAPILGHFVDVVGGEHKGRYGVFTTVDDKEEWGVVRSRDEFTDLLNVKVSDMRRAHAGRR